VESSKLCDERRWTMKKLMLNLRYWFLVLPVLAVPLFPNCPLSPFE
jgi:hypothetical protein